MKNEDKAQAAGRGEVRCMHAVTKNLSVVNAQGDTSMVMWCTNTHTCQAPAISDSWSVLHQQRCQPVAWRYLKNGNGNRFLFPRKKWGKQDPVSAVLGYLKTRKCVQVRTVQTCLNTRVWVRAHTGAQRSPYQSMRIQVRALQTAGNALTVNTRTSRVQVRVLPLVACGNSIEVRRNSNQCALKKKRQKRNIERRRETLLYIGINIE